MNLYEKYNNQCAISICLYNDITWDRSLWDKTESAYYKCKKLTNKRINNETNYVQSIVIKKATKLLHDNIRAYITNYFWQEKLMNLQKTIFEIKTLFNTINWGYQEWTRECS
jgi:hypothetical protein